MKKSVIALGIGASLGLAATFAGSAVRPGSDVPADVAHGIAAGIILGSRVWPYSWTAPQADSQPRLQLLSALCRWQGQCAGYGLAAATFLDGDPVDR